jgi:thiaminase II
MAAVTYALPFGPGNFIEYLLGRPDVAEAWKEHTEHIFLERLADGTLPIEAFKYYLIQDYLYLIQFARANMLAGYKTKNLEDIVRSAEIVLHINREMSLHLEYCAEFGLLKEDILKVEESQACTAYTRFVLDTGSSEDWLALQVALAPCLIGYGVIAKRLFADPKTLREGNRYWKWIENYAAADYSEAVELGIGMAPGKSWH